MMMEIAENIKQEMCDNYCKYPLQNLNQEDVDVICAACPLNKVYEEETK